MVDGTQINADERGFAEIWLRVLKIVALVLLVSGGVMILLVWSGVFDPKPVGTLQSSMRPIGSLSVTEQRQVRWLDMAVPEGDFSLRGTAVFQSGSPDSLYGFAIGSDENQLSVAVSPLGYTAITQSSVLSPQSSVLSPQSPIPLQPWPHVRTGAEPNEIWIDVVEDEVTVRINRELLWIGEVEGLGRQVGIVGWGFGETAVIDYPSLDLFWQNPE